MIVILGAIAEEIAAIETLIAAPHHQTLGPLSVTLGKIHNKEVAISRSGVGKVLAAATTQRLIDHLNPSAIIFTGLAGAINPQLEIGDIVIGVECIQHDLDARDLGFKRGEIPYTGISAIPADPKLLAVAKQFSAHRTHLGRILTGDQFITASNNHSYLRQELGGDCVEMEGAATALVGKINNIPTLITRTISDRADHTAKVDFEKFLPVAAENARSLVQFMVGRLV